ncbi:uncharacterized protein LOC116738697 [Nasonia vitripennis]|uniref:Uncharacterized protein n=1 Tax=Nasonia vitripennis TaxID=7425 RepID=A0A7M7R5U2_NASVI|nr:uncharacterized protein LOC116738697 [Nasonia vitripennis]
MDGNLISERTLLTNFFRKKNKKCYKCTIREASVNYKIKSYFCVELETDFLYHRHMECNLNSIPISLNLCNEEYNLVGLIAFDHGSDMLHYYTFIRLNDGQWEELNNLKNNIICHSKGSKIKVRPALVFYKRKNIYKRNLLTY